MTDRRRRRRTSGLTLLEVLAALAITAPVIGGAAMHLRTLRQVSQTCHARQEALQNARVALERLSLWIRCARHVAAVSGPQDARGRIELVDADGLTRTIKLVDEKLLVETSGESYLLASGVQSLRFEATPRGGPHRAVRIALEPSHRGGERESLSFTTLTRLRQDADAGIRAWREP